MHLQGHAVAQLVVALPYNPEARGFDSLWVHLRFFIGLIFSGRTEAVGVASASIRNEYRGYLVGSKGGRCVGPFV